MSPGRLENGVKGRSLSMLVLQLLVPVMLRKILTCWVFYYGNGRSFCIPKKMERFYRRGNIQVENSGGTIWHFLFFLELQKIFYFCMGVAISYKNGKERKRRSILVQYFTKSQSPKYHQITKRYMCNFPVITLTTLTLHSETHESWFHMVQLLMPN